MEIDNDIAADEKMDDDDGYKRYMRLHEIVNDLSDGSATRTYSWFTEHNHLLHIYDSAFKDFKTLHREIVDPTFRENCRVLDELINKLIKEYDSYYWFSLYDYLRFNKILILVADYVFRQDKEMEEESDLSALFTSLKV